MPLSSLSVYWAVSCSLNPIESKLSPRCKSCADVELFKRFDYLASTERDELLQSYRVSARSSHRASADTDGGINSYLVSVVSHKHEKKNALYISTHV